MNNSDMMLTMTMIMFAVKLLTTLLILILLSLLYAVVGSN